MHPLPRVNEVATEVDSLPNCAFFRQAENAVSIRIIFIAFILWLVFNAKQTKRL